ncbi:hypothetical protein H8356DRAFT_1357808 [Neocallimastix lanati (nom. inval.)]|nr:hypothetical protein H8356DRAFT_1357808 [Neocallimastix sp. JGI-2020a]
MNKFFLININSHVKLTKSENSTITGSFSKTSTNTTNTITSKYSNTINKFHIQNFKVTNENFQKRYLYLKLFLDSKEFGDYISKNIKDINTKKYYKYDSTVRIIILNSLDPY